MKEEKKKLTHQHVIIHCKHLPAKGSTLNETLQNSQSLIHNKGKIEEIKKTQIVRN
jgi:ubiquitin